MKRQDRHIIIGLLSFIIAFSSCKTNTKGDLTNAESGNIPTEFIDSLKSIGQEVQQNEIDPTKDNVIKGKNGTVIYISANSLVDEKGIPVSSKTIIELKEHYSIADYITSNLQTVHNNDILQTQGMIYFSAKKADGATVKIDKSKPIRIEFPVKEKIDEAKIFTGKRDEKGNLNWSEINEPSKYLIPYPIRFISQNRFPTECSNFYGITTDTIKNKYFNYYGDLSKFENTFLATREFKERYDVACWNEVLNNYINNLEKNLWEADELMVKHFIKDSIYRVNFELNNEPRGLNGGKPTKDQEKAHKWLIQNAKDGGHQLIELFKNFASQKLGKIDPSKKVADTTITQMKTAFVAYDALEFGWVNVDYFFNDPKSENVKLSVKTNEAPFIINLIIPNRKIILSGVHQNDNTYSFTKNIEGYNKLPKNEKAIILTINIIDNKMHFAEKEIIIGQKEIETIELKPMTAENIKARLNNYGS